MTPKSGETTKDSKPKPAMVFVVCVNNRAERSEYCVNAMFAMGWYAGAMGIKAISRTFDEHPISIARNAAMDMFENNKDFKDFTHILFIDSDVVPPMDTIQRLVSFNVPVASGWYLNRKGTGVPLVFKLSEETPIDPAIGKDLSQIRNGTAKFPSFKPYSLSRMLGLEKIKESGLSKVDGVGAGCLLISRETLPYLSKPYFYEDPQNFHGFGEDLYFALNCKLNGVQIYLDQKSFCGHVMWGVIDMRHVAAILKREQTIAAQLLEAKKKSPMPLAGGPRPAS